MDLTLTPAEEKFREECQVWLDAHVPREWHDPALREALTTGKEIAFLKSWQHTLHDEGWIGLTWPRQYGGRSATLMEQVIFNQAMACAKAPPLINVLGIIGLRQPSCAMALRSRSNATCRTFSTPKRSGVKAFQSRMPGQTWPP